jgi:hypothetical protein
MAVHREHREALLHVGREPAPPCLHHTPRVTEGPGATTRSPNNSGPPGDSCVRESHFSVL